MKEADLFWNPCAQNIKTTGATGCQHDSTWLVTKSVFSHRAENSAVWKESDWRRLTSVAITNKNLWSSCETTWQRNLQRNAALTMFTHAASAEAAVTKNCVFAATMRLRVRWGVSSSGLLSGRRERRPRPPRRAPPERKWRWVCAWAVQSCWSQAGHSTPCRLTAAESVRAGSFPNQICTLGRKDSESYSDVLLINCSKQDSLKLHFTAGKPSCV